MNNNNPTPIVAKAEQEDVLPGMASFLKAIQPSIVEARKRWALSHLQGWAVARSIYEYERRADVQQRLEVMRHREDASGRKKPGRPKTARGIVMDALERAGVVTGRTIRTWVYEWYSPASEEAAESGVCLRLELKPNCTAQEFSEALPETHPQIRERVEGLLKGTEADTEAAVERDIPSPKELADSVAHKLQKFFFVNGHPILRTRAQKDAFSKRLNVLFAQMNLEWEMMPHERH